MRGTKPESQGVPSRCPGWCCRERCRGEGRAGVLWGVTLSAPAVPDAAAAAPPCCWHLSLPSLVLGHWQPGCPAVQADEASVSSCLRPLVPRPLVPPNNFPTTRLCLQPASWRGVAWIGSQPYPLLIPVYIQRELQPAGAQGKAHPHRNILLAPRNWCLSQGRELAWKTV